MRTPKPLEARILFVLAAAIEGGYINYLAPDEILAALNRDGHHPTPNVFRRALAAMEADYMLHRNCRLPDGRVFSRRYLDELVRGRLVSADLAREPAAVFGVSDYYVEKLAGEFRRDDEPLLTLSNAARAAVELFYQRLFNRPAFA